MWPAAAPGSDRRELVEEVADPRQPQHRAHAFGDRHRQLGVPTGGRRIAEREVRGGDGETHGTDREPALAEEREPVARVRASEGDGAESEGRRTRGGVDAGRRQRELQPVVG